MNKSPQNQDFQTSGARGAAMMRAPSQLSDELDLSQVFLALLRGWFIIGSFTIVAGAAGIYYAQRVATPLYTASATVAFESRTEQVADLSSVVGGLGGDQVTINTEVEVLRSRGLIEKLVERHDLTADPEFNGKLRPKKQFTTANLVALVMSVFQPAPTGVATQPSPEVVRRAEINGAISAVLGKLAVANVRQSYVFSVTMTTWSAEKSAMLANSLAELYIQDQIDVKLQATANASIWLGERVAELKQELEQSAEAVKTFSAASDLVSPVVLEALNRQLKELRDREAETGALVAGQQANLTLMRTARDTGDFQTFLEVSRDALLRRQLQELQTALPEDGPVLTDRIVERMDAVVDTVERDMVRQQAQLAVVQQSITGLESRIARQSNDLVTLQQMEREADANGLIYEHFLNRLKETSVQEGIQSADSRILSRAVIPAGTSAPRKAMIVVMYMMMGIIAGAALVLGYEFTQNTFRSAEDLEKGTNYPVVGQVPTISGAGRRFKVLEYLSKKPTSAAAEAIRNMRTSLLLSNAQGIEPQIIMVTSSIPAEGKTTQSLGLAHNLSKMGKKTLLVEGDIRVEIFREYFPEDDGVGLVDVVFEGVPLEKAVKRSHLMEADILLGYDRRGINPVDLFASRDFKAFLERARKNYDYIIIDTAPVLLVADSRVIGQQVDAILYVVRWDSTRRSLVRDGLKSLEIVGLHATGLLLSQVNERKLKRYGYDSGYSSYGKKYYGQ